MINLPKALAAIKIILSCALAAAFFLPYTSCTQCLTAKQMRSKNIPEQEWGRYEKGVYNSLIKMPPDTQKIECYKVKEYHYAYEDLIDALRHRGFRLTSLLFICFIWPPVFMLAERRLKHRAARRALLVAAPVFALFSCGLIVYTSIIHPEAGAYISFGVNACFVILGAVEIKMKWKPRPAPPAGSPDA